MTLELAKFRVVEGRAYNMPLADMARAEAFRTLARCIRNPAVLREKGFKDLLGLLAWEERRIHDLEKPLPGWAAPTQDGDDA